MGIGENLSLEALEAHTGYSRFYLNRIFAEETGCTIHRYIMELEADGRRPRKLGETDKTIVEISGKRIISPSRRLPCGIPAGLRLYAVYLQERSISRRFVNRQNRRRQIIPPCRREQNLGGVRHESGTECDRDDVKGERSYDLFSRQLKTELSFLGEEVNDETSRLAVAQMLFLEAGGPAKDISFHINSPGGSKRPVWQYTIRCVISGVTYRQSVSGWRQLRRIFAGRRYEGKTVCAPNAEIMIHQPAVEKIGGKATDIQIYSEKRSGIREG